MQCALGVTSPLEFNRIQLSDLFFLWSVFFLLPSLSCTACADVGPTCQEACLIHIYVWHSSICVQFWTALVAYTWHSNRSDSIQTQWNEVINPLKCENWTFTTLVSFMAFLWLCTDSLTLRSSASCQHSRYYGVTSYIVEWWSPLKVLIPTFIIAQLEWKTGLMEDLDFVASWVRWLALFELFMANLLILHPQSEFCSS